MTETSSATTNQPDAPPAGDIPTVELRGVRVHAITEARCIDHILAGLDAGRGGWVVTPNTDILRRAVKDPEFRALLERASLIVPDGMPLIWASRVQGTPLPERVAGSTLVSTLASAAAAKGRSLYLLGGAPGAADGAARRLQEQFPGLRIAGTYCPPMGFEHDPAEMDRITQSLVAAAPDIVYVALGSPKQERLIEQLRPYLPGAWWLGVGISLGFLAGQVRRAPWWLQRVGMEWLHRLAQEPGRLGRRYLVDGVPFGINLMVHAALCRCGVGKAPIRTGEA